MAIPSLSPGVEVAGYRVEAVIGRGGMGVVYLAEDIRLKRKVALKLLSPELAEDAGFRSRFLEESELAASLDHPNVVPIYEAGEAEQGLFIAMRYVEGGDLKKRLGDGALAPAEAADLIAQLADALDAAHARGLVHGDVKPSNALLAPGTGHGGSEHVYLADFGLTKRLADAAAIEDGPALGTIDYVAPEQIAGEGVDGRADVYSLGCVLYQCLVGRPPYAQRSEAATLFAHLEESPPSASDVRPELGEAVDSVIATALAKRPDERYESGAQLTAAAREALGLGEPSRSRWGLPVVLALAGVAAIAVAVAAYLVVTGGGSTPSLAAADSVVRIDPATNRSSTPVTLDGEPEAVAIGGGAIWVATYRHSSQSQGISRIDPATGAFMRTYDADAGFATAIATGAGTVWALYNRHGPNPHEQLTPAEATTAGTGSDSIQRLRPDGSFTPAATYQYGFQGVAVGSNAVWALTVGGQLWRIDPGTGTVVKRQLPSTFPYHPGLVATGAGAVWVVHGPPACTPPLNSGQDPDCPGTLLTRVDPATGKPAWTVRLPFEPAGMAIGDAAVWLTDGVAGSVARVDPGTGRISATIPVGRDPVGIATAPGAVWVANSGDGTVSRLDPSTSRVVRTIAVGERPTGVAADRRGAWVTVAATF